MLLHVEVQTQRQRGFGRRMYGYNTRIFDHFGRTVVSLAMLADDDPNWRPKPYDDALWGWSVNMTFPAVKLLDWANREAELEANTNPFARFVLAHLKALETGRSGVPAGLEVSTGSRTVRARLPSRGYSTIVSTDRLGDGATAST